VHQLTLPINSEEFHIRRSLRAKRLRISINLLGQIEVIAPKNVYARDIDHFIQSHREWIRRKKHQVDSMRSMELNTSMPTLINLPAIKEQWHVTYTVGLLNLKTGKEHVTKNNSLHLSINHDSQSSDLLKKWLNKKAKSALLPWLEKVSNETGLPYSQASIRGQKTRWGSCSADKNISLNRCMLFLQPEQVRYLMIHELCHTLEMNHSSRFWKLVSRYVPDYQHQEARVNECCYRLPRWVF